MVRIGKTGRVRLTGIDLTLLRRACFNRDDWKCTVCGIAVRWERGWLNSGEMAHIVSRGAGGSDVLPNVKLLCKPHHHEEHQGGKPCPKK